jgi:hypothetical protein
MRDEAPAVAPARASTLPRPPAPEVLFAWIRHMWEAVKDVAASGRLAWVIAYSAVVFVLLRSTVYLYQPYLDARHFSTREIGLIYAGVYLVASFVAHRGHMLRSRFGDDVLLWVLLGGLSATFLLLGELRGPWVIGILGIQALANGLYSPLVKPLLNKEITESARRATVLSVESIARRLAMLVFAPIVGAVGPSSSIVLCGALGVVGLIVLAVTGQRQLAGGNGLPSARVVERPGMD